MSGVKDGCSAVVEESSCDAEAPPDWRVTAQARLTPAALMSAAEEAAESRRPETATNCQRFSEIALPGPRGAA